MQLISGIQLVNYVGKMYSRKGGRICSKRLNAHNTLLIRRKCFEYSTCRELFFRDPYGSKKKRIKVGHHCSTVYRQLARTWTSTRTNRRYSVSKTNGNRSIVRRHVACAAALVYRNVVRRYLVALSFC
jgi:hypothetical protein